MAYYAYKGKMLPIYIEDFIFMCLAVQAKRNLRIAKLKKFVAQ